ncbi:transposase [Aureimonas pseudogalii]|uniref:Transposase n=1 Tax=Aureimonas pseudogalii TaxID=1744844 RepID=A0A7W6H8S4_9HYPH|nr:transposase [Aureimonas pseudogalii]MBB4000642.1 transposase [Aureimonas pseudogalii]
MSLTFKRRHVATDTILLCRRRYGRYALTWRDSEELAAWIGIMPSACSSGDEKRLGGRTRRGNAKPPHFW